jgi:hypothetical protein
VLKVPKENCPTAVENAAYDKLERFLSNNLDSVDYEEYWEALEVVWDK